MAAMERRLTKEVTRMRAQLMSFSNDGSQVSLNVPDTNEVKDVFSSVVTTVVQQQKQITTLQTSMKQMADDHCKSQEALIAWTTQCVQELLTQNAATEARLQDAKQQLRNFSRNVQGFDDEVDNAPPPPMPMTIRPPVVVKTATPQIISDPQEVGEGNGDTLFPTETGAPSDASLNVSENQQRWGGHAAGSGSDAAVQQQQNKPHRKSVEQRNAAQAFYQSVKSITLPAEAKGRWHWAFKKVLWANRTKSLKIGLARAKMPLHLSAVERLERIENELFTIPIVLKQFVGKETGKLYVKIADEVAKIDGELESQRLETTRLCSALQSNIEVVADNLQKVDERLVALKEQVDNANKQADEIERKLNNVISRVGEHEMCLFDSIRARIRELSSKVEIMRGHTTSTTDKLNLLAEEEERTRVEVEEALANPLLVQDSEEEGQKLFAMLDYDTKLRSARIEINALDSSAFAVAEILRALRYELLSISVLAGADNAVEKEAVNEMLASVDAVASVLDVIFSAVQASNNLWAGHDHLLASRWKTLAGMADAVKMVASMAATLEDVRQTIATMPTTDVVQEMAEKIATDVSDQAVQPLGDKMDGMQVGLRDLTAQIQVVRQEISDFASRPGGIPADLDAQLEPLIQKIVEMYVGSGGVTSAPKHSVVHTQSPGIYRDLLFTAEELEAYGSEIIDDETANHELEQGTTVRVIAGQHRNRQGIITAVEPVEQQKVVLEEGGTIEADNSDTVEAMFGEALGITDVLNREVRYRVTLSPETPLQTPYIRSGEAEGLAPPSFGDFPAEQLDFMSHAVLSMPESRDVISVLQREIDKLAGKIEDLLSRPPQTTNNLNNNAGEIDASLMTVITSSIQDVLAQLGDLREMQKDELIRAKQQMKQHILTAITKAITDKDKEDKESFLTTRSMCIGCGRPSLVRKEDNSAPAVSLGFHPSLSTGIIPGPDVYRSGFRLPVTKKRSPSPPHSASLQIGFTDDIFEDRDVDSERNTVTTYSEILAGMAGVTSASDVGPAGIVLNISPCKSPCFLSSFSFSPSHALTPTLPLSSGLSPVRQLSSTAKSIRHAQGREEAAMLRPIHRKGFPGKVTRSPTPGPERFDLLDFQISSNKTV